MNIILGEKEIPIITAVSHAETIDGVQRNIIELWTDEPLTSGDIEYIKTHDSFTNDMGGTYDNYKEVVRYSTWLAQVDPNAVIVRQVTAEKEAAIKEKEAAVQAKETLQTVTIPTLLRGRADDVLVEMLDYIPEWVMDEYAVGDVRKDASGYPKICVQAHNSIDNPEHDITVASLWAPYHAKSKEHALPWIAPTGAHDMYKKGEFMIWGEGAVYECLEDTDRGPDILPNNWKVEGAVTEPPAEEPPTQDPPAEPPAEEPPAPVEKNSNGTDVWSEWVVWNNLNETLYQIGDRVTVSNVKYIAILGNNHWNPTSGMGWEPYTEPQA